MAPMQGAWEEGLPKELESRALPRLKSAPGGSAFQTRINGG